MERLTCNELKTIRDGFFIHKGNRKDGAKYRMLAESSPKYEEIYRKLADYEDAEKKGLLLRLPCKVGDTVYCFGFGGEIIEGVCKAIQIDEKYKMVFIEGKDFCFWKMFEKFGKTVFLTKEEAEQALKQMGE